MTSGPGFLRLEIMLHAPTLGVASTHVHTAFDASGLDAPAGIAMDDRPEQPDWPDRLEGAQRLAFSFASPDDFGDLYPVEGHDGLFRLMLEYDAQSRDETMLGALLHRLAALAERMADSGTLDRALIRRHRGGQCLPIPPLAEGGTHLATATDAEIAAHYADPAAFLAAWDKISTHGSIRLLRRGFDHLPNPDFLDHIRHGQMAMVRAAKDGTIRFDPPVFAEGEFDLLDADEPTLSSVGYFPEERLFEFAGHLAPGQEIRPLDLLLARRIAASGRVEQGPETLPVSTVRATFDNEGDARRTAPLLRQAGLLPCYVDDEGELREA